MGPGRREKPILVLNCEAFCKNHAAVALLTHSCKLEAMICPCSHLKSARQEVSGRGSGWGIGAIVNLQLLRSYLHIWHIAQRVACTILFNPHIGM